jgi:hypothetical protein
MDLIQSLSGLNLGWNKIMKRPPSIWITQGIIAIFALLFFSGVLRSLFRSGFEINGWTLFRLILITTLMAIWIGAFWGLVKKTQWGKWLAVLSLAILLGFINYSNYVAVNRPVKEFEYSNDAQRAGGRDSKILIQLSLILLMSRLIFSKKVNRYFQSHLTILETSQQTEAKSTPNENV